MMKSDLPSPLRVGVWGAVSYIVGKLFYSLMSLILGALAIAMAFGFVIALFYACQLWPTWELCTG